KPERAKSPAATATGTVPVFKDAEGREYSPWARAEVGSISRLANKATATEADANRSEEPLANRRENRDMMLTSKK
ncbi:MAG: hypothetical protein WA626_17650, partial [Acidobacteriaceae bacterium]